MINEKYSHNSFINKSFLDVSPEEFNGVIENSCFYQENKPNSKIFPEGINCIFKDCNLDNVLIPSGCEVIGGTNKKIKAQEDGFDWILDDDLNPIERL